MARNRITGRETQKMQEYTQEQISQAERRGIEISTDVKEQLFEYANLIGEEEKVRTLVRNLADVLSKADEESVEDLLDDARMDIQDLPDPTIGKLELLLHLIPLCSGANEVVVSTEDFLRNPRGFFDYVKKYKGTVTMFPNFAVEMLVNYGKKNDICLN